MVWRDHTSAESTCPARTVVRFRHLVPKAQNSKVILNTSRIFESSWNCDVLQQKDFQGFSIAHGTLKRWDSRANLITDRMIQLPLSRQARSESDMKTLDSSIPQGWAPERGARLPPRATFQLVDGTDITQPRIPPSAMSLSKRRRFAGCVTSFFLNRNFLIQRNMNHFQPYHFGSSITFFCKDTRHDSKS